MRDITDQLAAYAELLDQSAPPVAELVTADVDSRPPRKRARPGLVVAGAAIGVLVVVGGLAALSRTTTPSVPPVATSTAPVVSVAPFVVDLLNPQAITPAMFSEWDHPFAGPGAVTVIDGTFHMLSAAYGEGAATVAYATSDDGVVWRQGSNQPVIDLSQAPWAPLSFDHALPRSVVVDSEGTWQLFFEIAWFEEGADEFRSNIGRVVARDPLGAWVFDTDPIIRPNRAQPWMAKKVSSPSAVATDGGLLMVFVGSDGEEGVVGLAQSANGAEWEVRPGPVFGASGDWERGSIARVDLIAAPGGLAMFYTGDTSSRRGLAVSSTGLEWATHPANPLLTTLDLPRASVFDSEFVTDGNDVLAYIENGGVRSDREVVVLRLSLDLERLIAQLLG